MKEKIENAIGLVYTVVEALCRLVLIFMVCMYSNSAGNQPCSWR